MPNVAGRLLQLLMCMDCNCGNARLGESVIALAGMPAWRLISDGGWHCQLGGYLVTRGVGHCLLRCL